MRCENLTLLGPRPAKRQGVFKVLKGSLFWVFGIICCLHLVAGKRKERREKEVKVWIWSFFYEINRKSAPNIRWVTCKTRRRSHIILAIHNPFLIVYSLTGSGGFLIFCMYHFNSRLSILPASFSTYKYCSLYLTQLCCFLILLPLLVSSSFCLKAWSSAQCFLSCILLIESALF